MRRVPFSLYLLPARPGSPPGASPRVSSWKMSPAEAAGVGALYPVAGSTEYRDLPDLNERTAGAGPQPAAEQHAAPPRQ